MRGNIMYTKWQRMEYAVQRSFLMNENFLESFLLIFGQNKQTNL